jgi:GNAT superfamily N-acetyltransferase
VSAPLRVRPARADDLPALAMLVDALGDPSAQEDLARRIAALDASEHHALLVADEGGPALGLAHVILRRSLLVEPYAELAALVVAPGARGKGVGARLVRAAEAWAASQGLAALRLRTRLEREDAHRFYRAQGFALAKTQLVFALDLAGRSGSGSAGGERDPAVVD